MAYVLIILTLIGQYLLEIIVKERIYLTYLLDFKAAYRYN